MYTGFSLATALLEQVLLIFISTGHLNPACHHDPPISSLSPFFGIQPWNQRWIRYQTYTLSSDKIYCSCTLHCLQWGELKEKKKKTSWNIRQLPKFISGTKLCYKPNKCIIKCVEAKAITQTRPGYQHRRLSSKHNLWGRTATLQFRSLHPALCGLGWNFSFCPQISFVKIRTRLSLKALKDKKTAEGNQKYFLINKCNPVIRKINTWPHPKGTEMFHFSVLHL